MAGDTITKILELRDMTGAGVLDCKKALDEAKGNFDLAVSIIRERGYQRAEKKKERAAGAGLIESYLHNNRVGVLLVLRAETDFAVRSDEVKNLAHNLAMQIAAMDPGSIDDLLKQVYIRDESLTVENVIKRSISKIGENIQVEKFCRYEV